MMSVQEIQNTLNSITDDIHNAEIQLKSFAFYPCDYKGISWKRDKYNHFRIMAGEKPLSESPVPVRLENHKNLSGLMNTAQKVCSDEIRKVLE